MEEKQQVIRERTKTFIKRERVRRELLRIKPNETICLQGDTVEIILVWIKELEERAGVHGITEV